MGNLLARVRQKPDPIRHDTGILPNVSHLGALWSAMSHTIGGMSWNPQASIEGDHFSVVSAVHQDHGPVPAAVVARMLLVGQFFPRWRRNSDGGLFGLGSLAPLERPLFHPRSDLYRRAELDVSYAGTAYFHRTIHSGKNDVGIRLLSPTRTRIIVGTSLEVDPGSDLRPEDVPDAFVKGYRYRVTGSSDADPTATYRYFSPDDVSHWAPEPDPLTLFAGASWVTSVLREIQGDKQVADHVDGFLERGAIPGLAVVFADPESADELEGYRKVIEQYHSGPSSTGRTLVLAGGASVQQIGFGLDAMALRDLTAGFETRIAARSRVPATILGIREGLQGSALNAGNYQTARRMWGDGWVTPTLESLAAALEPLIEKPGDAELHYDPARIGFLQEDEQDKAQIAQTNAGAIRSLIDGGFEPDAAVLAVATGNFAGLKSKHTGLPSVQLQPNDAAAPKSEPTMEDA